PARAESLTGDGEAVGVAGAGAFRQRPGQDEGNALLAGRLADRSCVDDKHEHRERLARQVAGDDVAAGDRPPIERGEPPRSRRRSLRALGDERRTRVHAAASAATGSKTSTTRLSARSTS